MAMSPKESRAARLLKDAKAIVLPYDPDLERRERCNRAPTPTVKRAGRAVPPARAVAAIAGRHPVLLSA